MDYLAESQAPTREEIDRTPGLVVLEFGTDWCGFCRAAAPQVESLVRRHPGLKPQRGPSFRSRNSAAAASTLTQFECRMKWCVSSGITISS